MGRFVEWSDELSVGVEEIDEQHKVLVGLVNEMHEAIHQRHGSEVVQEILAKLADYTRIHFAVEESLMRILNYQDDIADTAQDLCVLLTMRKTKVPEELKEDVRRLAEKGIEVCRVALGAAEELDLLMESSFSGPEAKRVLEKADATGQMEYEADIIAQTALKKLFEIEDKLDPITIVFCMRILNVIGMRICSIHKI